MLLYFRKAILKSLIKTKLKLLKMMAIRGLSKLAAGFFSA